MKLSFKKNRRSFFILTAVISVFLAVLIPGCQKGADALAKTDEFSAAAAKEWYYGVFKKVR